MELDFDRVQEIFKRCGYPQLYAKDPRDAAIIFALTHKLTVMAANEMLDRNGFETL